MEIDLRNEQPDPRQLRNALGCFGTGVTVVTTLNHTGEHVGLTANSFSSVSLNPPIVLWSLSARSPNVESFTHTGRFVINILSAAQVHLSQQFSRHLPDKFTGVERTVGLHGLPVIEHCTANIECVIVSAQAVGDHILYLGKVERYRYTRKDPLLYCHGAYIKAVDHAFA